MSQTNYKYIYGPVSSWRLGSSLGIDPISRNEKICSFDCIYCQIGRTETLTDERKNYVETAELVKELESFPNVNVDHMTFSGRGEPTLAANLGEMIRGVKKIRSSKIAVITNSSLLYRDDVQQDISLADCVVAKLDAPSQELFELINRPIGTVAFNDTLSAIKRFNRIYKGRLALQIMFVEENKDHAFKISQIVREINPDEVQINTPLRKCDLSPLPQQVLDDIEKLFHGMKTLSVYRTKKIDIVPISACETLKRRGK